jgi:ADP-heptose:LPS heptosyltransferase
MEQRHADPASMRILIVNITRIGDQLQTSPTIAGLRERYPDADITMAGDAQHTEVCYGIPGVAHVYELDLNRIGRDLLRGGTKLVDAYRYVEQVVRDLRAHGYDLAFNFSSSRMSSVFMRLLRIPDCRGWMMDSEGNRLIVHPWSRLFVASVLNRRFTPYNLVDFYCRVAGVRPRERRLWYTPTRGAEGHAAALLSEAGVREGDRVIALQPGASNAVRQWPATSFATLGRLVHERLGAWILLVGSAADRPLCEEIATEVGERAIIAAGRTDIPVLAALLDRAMLLVTGDTGPMHLATAVGTPVVAFFFGPAYVWETGPYGADNIAFQTRLQCSPCHHAARCLAPICREELTPEMVFWAVNDRLAQDYVTLSCRARSWSAVDVYRTSFDAGGMYDPIPLAPRLDATEALRLLYREMWRAALDGAEDNAAAQARLAERWQARRGHAAAIDFREQRRALERLHTLGRRGQTLAATLLIEAGQADPSMERLEALTAEMEEVDARIAQQGYVEEAVATLSRTFTFTKENLSDTRTLEVIGRETVDLYRGLGQWTALSLELLDVIDGRAAPQRESVWDGAIDMSTAVLPQS